MNATPTSILSRKPRTLDPARTRDLIRGKRVLVTGAGGTIGGELTRRAAAQGPERLILLDASEFNLYGLDQHLAETGSNTSWAVALGDVRDRARLEQVFEQHRPEIVLHAAALKHVPLMETHPCEAVLTNVGGVVHVMELAREASEAFVFVSTDKAVNPTNVMGATKRVGERVVQALAADSLTRAAIVRFGNVLGSTGSVVPLFERQIARGGPVTVTHRDMTRWFMTVGEAAELVLQAATLPDAGKADVFVLDMGEAVRIDDLARQLIRLAGLEPDLDIKIQYTDLRPGEKLTEEIFYAEEDVSPTRIDGVMAARAETASLESLKPDLDALLAAAAARDEAETLARLEALEPEFSRR
ncbi:UDP-N-acetylglucosamine 4,6-dehydratase family protein [Brevundimonas aveniformis]|uniref:UDP-N-acetylglucosamine 4,6-dehydratase family protein n=1 Tax=Brevundimonas aveniformis TaxID=370977 RepID=UPI00041CEE05|nr:SDR family NAD(P)-dependent oxidoreductase [Brevundimonas aveniformis]